MPPSALARRTLDRPGRAEERYLPARASLASCDGIGQQTASLDPPRSGSSSGGRSPRSDRQRGLWGLPIASARGGAAAGFAACQSLPSSAATVAAIWLWVTAVVFFRSPSGGVSGPRI